MARPIRETPILSGDDAIRFMQGMQAVERLSIEERRSNQAELQHNYQQALNHIQICI